jgi:mitogen-activated protein kinase kinase kinase
MLEGMAYLHGLPALVSHGDLKPSNVLLNGQGTVKLNDFGAATSIFRANGGVVTRSSTPGPAPTMDGTPMFMAPEKIKGGPRSHHGAADVWALGCIVLQMCTGRQPWAELDDEW